VHDAHRHLGGVKTETLNRGIQTSCREALRALLQISQMYVRIYHAAPTYTCDSYQLEYGDD